MSGLLRVTDVLHVICCSLCFLRSNLPTLFDYFFPNTQSENFMISGLSTEINICLTKHRTTGVQDKPPTISKPVHVGLVLQLLLLLRVCGSHHPAQRSSVGDKLKV